MRRRALAPGSCEPVAKAIRLIVFLGSGGLTPCGAHVLLLIDGYNVIAPAAPPGRASPTTGRGKADADGGWLQRARVQLLKRLADRLDPALAHSTWVVFDAAGRIGRRAHTLRAHGIQVRFAVDHDEADDLIEELIAAHHSPKRLTVVSSDHRLHAAARRAGATAYDSQPWLDALLDGKLMLAIPWPPQRAGHAHGDQRSKPQRVSPEEARRWLHEFGISADGLQESGHAEPQVDQGGAHGPVPQRAPRRTAGQGREGQGRAGEQNPPPAASRPEAHQQRNRRVAKQRRSGKERPAEDTMAKEQPPAGYNPFPEGYGEDLLP